MKYLHIAYMAQAPNKGMQRTLILIVFIGLCVATFTDKTLCVNHLCGVYTELIRPALDLLNLSIVLVIKHLYFFFFRLLEKKALCL